jgi:hypothetical protein
LAEVAAEALQAINEATFYENFSCYAKTIGESSHRGNKQSLVKRPK